MNVYVRTGGALVGVHSIDSEAYAGSEKYFLLVGKSGEGTDVGELIVELVSTKIDFIENVARELGSLVFVRRRRNEAEPFEASLHIAGGFTVLV